jgi:hypothetical protein
MVSATCSISCAGAARISATRSRPSSSSSGPAPRISGFSFGVMRVSRLAITAL